MKTIDELFQLRLQYDSEREKQLKEQVKLLKEINGNLTKLNVGDVDKLIPRLISLIENEYITENDIINYRCENERY